MINNIIMQAIEFQKNNQFDKAKELYNQILSQDSNNIDALHNLGLLYGQLKQSAKAIFYLKKAVELSPTTPVFHNNLGNAYKQAGQFDLALIHYFEALKLKSPYPEAHNNLGGLYYQQGKLPEAILEFEKSIRIQPLQANTHYNLANCYLKNNQLLKAIPHFEKVLEIIPNHLGALHNLGMSFSILKQYDKAYGLLQKVLEHDPNNTEILFQLAVIENTLGNLEAAKEHYLKIISLNPKYDNAYHNLATVYLHEKNQEKALYYYQKALDLNPSNMTAQHMIYALTQVAHPEGAPPEYIAALFNQYAYSYNTHVKQKLEYQVPSLLREAITPFVGSKLFKILDLGCGTGLCAPYFTDIADKIIGVDISANMLEIARLQGGYSRLILDDIKNYLETLPEKHSFDLILAADVFVYFAELKTVLNQCKQALNTGGLLLFSIENVEGESLDAAVKPRHVAEKERYLLIDHNTVNTASKNQHKNQDYDLQPSGRYRHNPDYINKIASELNFDKKYEQKAILRHENNEPVWGTIFMFCLDF